MKSPIHNELVYWIEADEESQLLAHRHKTRSIGRRSMLAYALMGRTIVVHPADLWQSHTSNALFFDHKALPLIQKMSQIDRGRSDSITQYITDRMIKLKGDKASSRTNVELQQYLSQGAHIHAQSDELDTLFTGTARIFRSSDSRDKRFRKLILDDLSNPIPFGPHLAASIRQGVLRKNSDRLMKSLAGLLHDNRRFVSIDGIVTRISDMGCHKVPLKSVYQRLQILHWKSRHDGSIEMPFLSRHVENKLDSADPDVFWNSIDQLFGEGIQSDFMALPWQTSLEIAYELRNDSIWREFIAVYHSIVETVDADYLEIADSMICSTISKRYPSNAAILWNNRPDKWTALSWVCHIGSWCIGVPTGVSLALRLISGLCVGKRMLDCAFKLTNALYDSDRRQIMSRIRKMTRDAT